MNIRTYKPVIKTVSKHFSAFLPTVCVMIVLSGCDQSYLVKRSGSYRFYNFEWQDDPSQFADLAKPVSYEIQIATDKAFSSIIDRDTVGLSRYVHDQPFDHGSYFWRVRTMPYDGEASAWSEVKAFSIVPHKEIVTVAVPHGSQDCTEAVQSSVKEAEGIAASGSSVKLVFPAGDYYCSPQFEGALIQFRNVKDIEIEGKGATIHFTNRKQGLIQARGCTNLSVNNLHVTYAKDIFRVQGRILKTDLTTRSAVVAIEKDAPDFSASQNIFEDIFILLDKEHDGRLKDKSSSFYRMEGYVKNPDGTYTIEIDKGGDFSDWEVGGRFVYHFRTGSAILVNFSGSSNVTAYNLTTDGWGEMGFVSVKGTNFNVLHCNTVFNDGNWMMGNADGVHIREHVVGPWIEKTHLQGLGDDGVALYARPMGISALMPGENRKAVICDSVFFNLEQGNEISIFQPTQGKILFETEVAHVKRLPDGRYEVHFTDEIPKDIALSEFVLSSSSSNKDAKAEHAVITQEQIRLQDKTQIWNRSKSCGEFVIRNSEFTDIRRYGNVFRAKRGILENNLYRGTSSSAIKCLNETAWPNGLYASDIIVRNNVIDKCGFDANTHAAISFVFTRHKGGKVEDMGSRNLLIEGNIFIDCPSPNVSLESAKNVILRNNRQKRDRLNFEAIQYESPQSENIQVDF